MNRHVLMDEFHLSLLAPRTLSAAECDALRRTLDDAHFHALLRRAVRRLVHGVTGAFERFAEHGPQLGFVFDKEDGFH